MFNRTAPFAPSDEGSAPRARWKGEANACRNLEPKLLRTNIIVAAVIIIDIINNAIMFCDTINIYMFININITP